MTRRPQSRAVTGLLRALTVAMGLTLGAVILPVVAPAPAEAGTAIFPIAVDPGDAKQMVTVAVAPGATTGTLQTYEKTPTGWVEKFPAQVAKVGSAGLTSNARDFYPGTPIGKFALTESFGRQPNPGTKLSYFKTDTYDWWAGDKTKASYNNHVRCVPGSCPMSENLSEHLLPIGAVYDYSVVMDYNREPAVAGKGAAFFLHVTDGRPTAGCVAISRASLVQIMRWLDPAKKPVIALNYAKVTSVTYNNDSIGKITSASSGAGATMTGWAWDPDAPTTAMTVKATVDGAQVAQVVASAPSTSGSAYPQAGANHGFSIPLQLAAGKHSVCVYGVNLGPPGANTKLACATVYGRGDWYLSPVPALGPITNVQFGLSTLVAGVQVLGCDIDGSGVDRLTTYRNGVFSYSAATTGAPITTRAFGQAGDVGFCGDWNGDGVDTPGVRRGNVFYLTDASTGIATRTISFGLATGDQPLAGDWTGSGKDSIGVWRASTASAYLRPALTSAYYKRVPWAASGVTVVTGDWNNDGADTLGAFRSARWELANGKFGRLVSSRFTFGLPGDTPVTGRWGVPGSVGATAIGVVR